MPKIPAPLFVDPLYNGAADPMIIQNRQTGVYYLFYTQRRASQEVLNSVSYCYGTKIGVAECTENGGYWYYRGALDLEFEFGQNTFWAPEIIWDEQSGLYHMYVTYIRGMHVNWKGDESIQHYTSTDLFHWTRVGKLDIGSQRIIDPCLFPLPQGGWRMWYKDDERGARTFYADSADLYHWETAGQATFDQPQEGPNVFELGGKYWLIACEWKGQGIYSSDDLTHFVRQEGKRLLSEEGTRPLDGPVGRHADVITCNGEAYIVYFVHPADEFDREAAVGHPPTVVQMAKLSVVDGKLCCDRNAAAEIDLR